MAVGAYATRRVLRIVPAYWLALTVFIAAGFVSGVTANNWWIFYGFGQVYSWDTVAGGLGVAWSLCVEVTFYAALPLFVWLAARRGARPRAFSGDLILIGLLAALSVVYRAHYTGFTQVPKILTLAGTFLWFGVGMALAVVSVGLESRTGVPRSRRRAPESWPVLSWSGAAVLFALGHEAEVHASSLGPAGSAAATYVLAGSSALLVLLPAVFEDDRGGVVRAVLRTRALGWIGLISYGFYLYHTVVISQLRDLIGHASVLWRYAAVTVGSFLVSLLCAAASYYVLERPVMLLGRRVRRGRTAT